MDRWLGKTAVVTGAASGIGEAITRALLQNGVNVAALDVQKERLAKLDAECRRESFPGTLHTIRCDVSLENEIDAAFLRVESMGGVDIMVNNAGVCEYSRVIGMTIGPPMQQGPNQQGESDRKAFERLLNINVLAVAVCINRAVRSMRNRNVEGHVFNINSVLGHYLPPNLISEQDGFCDFNLYPASKHGTVALTHTVRRELAAIKVPIRITSISPGIVKTNINEHSKALKDFFDKVPALRPKDIADALIYALGTRPEVQITELTIQHTGEFP